MGGNKIVKMERLKKLLAGAGFANVVTYIQSGNVVFDAEANGSDELGIAIEKILLHDFAFEVKVAIRPIEAVKAILATHPYPEGQLSGNNLYVHFLSRFVDSETVQSLTPFLSEGEQVALSGTELYFATPAYGKTKLTNNVVEKCLGVVSTARNWTTVSKVATL